MASLRAGDENRTRMTSLEDRDHGAHRRAPSRPRALMTDPGLPTLALFNGPLMAHVISVTGPAVVHRTESWAATL
jgi:hypothetical protein